MKENLIIHVVPDKVQREYSALYSVPGTHVIFTGPRECARHNCRMHYRLGRISWLCPTDTELAMGRLESMVLDSVDSLIERYASDNRNLFGVILYTGCQTEFLNVDFEYLQRKIREKYHIAAAHHSISRFQRFDRMRLAERDIYGDVFRLLEPIDETEAPELELSERGIQILSRPVPMASENDFLFIAKSAGLGWIRNTGEWETADEFLRCREAILNIVTSKERIPAAEYLESGFGIPWIKLEESYRLSLVDENYRILQEKLRDIPAIGDVSAKAEELRRQTCEHIEDALKAVGGRSLTLNLQNTGRPWDVTRALTEYGFQIEKIVVKRFPMPPGMKPPPGMGFSHDQPEDREWVENRLPSLKIEEVFPDFRGPMRSGESIMGLPDYLDKMKGKENAESDCSVSAGPGGPGGGSLEASYWGYSGIRMLMNQIQKGSAL